MNIPLSIQRQPDDVTCGPTSLHAIYDYYKDMISLSQVISQVQYLGTGGTLAPLLGCHALKRGYRVTLFTSDIVVFDPTWFQKKGVSLSGKLRDQMKHKTDTRFKDVSKAYIQFLGLGGKILFQPPSFSLLKKYLNRKIPLLTGVSSTFLRQESRDMVDRKGEARYDDVRGCACGHFVVLSGYNKKRQIVVNDPYRSTPKSRRSTVDVEFLIAAMMLGILTSDADFLAIEK